MNEYLYGINSVVIALVLLVSMVVATELGYRHGHRRQALLGEAAKEHVNGVQASILGIVALLLGFTFSLSLQRFDSRSAAVVGEANAIGTAFLRVDLLPAPMRAEVRALMRDYVDQRVQAGQLTLLDREAFQALSSKATATQAALWQQARKAIEVDASAYPPTMFAEAINQMSDSFSNRNAALDRHVPEVVLLLLHATFLMAAAIAGYSSGVSGHRPLAVHYVMMLLMVVLVFIILDLDRPQRGLVLVSERSMLDLQRSVQAVAGAPAR
jgi:uncharacterized membrane protein YoaK (UPF0700 family)